jgi:hypothetical protein
MLDAYCWPLSVAPTEPIELHVSTDQPSFEVDVVRDHYETTTEWKGSGSGEHHAIPPDAAAAGCRWPATLTMPAPAHAGVYVVHVTSGSERSSAMFVVRGANAPILLVLSTATYNAYNDWGGPSLYTGGTRVSFERPLAAGFVTKPEPALRKAQATPDREALAYFHWAEPLGLSNWSGGSGWPTWERPFLAWAEREGYRIDVAISQDLELHPEVLDGRRLFLSVGHDEYWSAGMRDTVEAHLARGRNAAFFSGNTCYWRVVPDDGFHSMECRKYGVGPDDDSADLSGAWSDRRIARPENAMTGLSFTRGGYSRYGLGVPMASGAYTAYRPDHWAFEGADLRYGDALGLADAIVGYEVDGCELAMVDGRPMPTFADGTPETLEVLATAPARLWSKDEQPSRYAHEPGELEYVAESMWGEDWPAQVHRIEYNHAVVATFEHPGGGTVFNAGCTDWTYGLDDPTVASVTRNVLSRLSA